MSEQEVPLSITQIQKLLSEGAVSSRKLTDRYLSRVHASKLNTFLESFEDARSTSEEADAKRAKGGDTGPFAGVPIALKDNILVEGRRVSAGSKILEGYKAVYDATVTAKLREAGFVFLGRTNMDEFAMGSSTENSAYGVVKNPHDSARVPGGSSGGSAAAVAAGEVPAALGSDTGGSVRQPAAFCGVVGLKPTYGAVSRYGLIAMGSSLDQIGPLTRTVEDAESLFDVIKGRDINDSTSREMEKVPEKVATIGVPRDVLEIEGIDSDVKEHFLQTVEDLQAHGYRVVDVSLPHIPLALSAYYIIMPAEASSNLARFDGQRYGLSIDGETLYEVYTKTRGDGFGKEVRRRIILGTYVLSSGYYDAYYRKAIEVRRLISNDFKNAFRKVDALVLPTTPTPAFRIGEKVDDPLSMYLSDIFTVPANISGVPAMTVPSGYAKREGSKLPLGFQVIAPWGGEKRLFKVGRVVEENKYHE